jgi:glycosyltransferase involved in cell wall biosynthesis
MRLSFIVPVYNTLPYLAECLDSICAQRVALEVICVDDGSKDGSGAFLDEYAKRDSRVKVLHQENSGLSAARNNGLLHARGSHIAFVDSDDWLTQGYSDIVEGALQGTDADMLVMNATVNDEAAGCEYPFYDDAAVRSLTPIRREACLAMGSHSRYFFLEPNTSRRVFSRNFIQRMDLRYPEGLVYEDFPVHFQAGLLTRNIVVSRGVGLHYRIALGRTSITQDGGERRKQIVPIMRMTLDLLHRHQAADEVYTAFISALVRAGWWCYAKAVDPAVKRHIRHGLSAILATLPKKHHDAFLKIADNPRDRQNFYALKHDVPGHIIRNFSPASLENPLLNLFLKLISKF